jgi:hypothetical protein
MSRSCKINMREQVLEVEEVGDPEGEDKAVEVAIKVREGEIIEAVILITPAREIINATSFDACVYNYHIYNISYYFFL